MNKKAALIIILTIFTLKLSAQSDEKIRAIWVFNVSNYVNWPNEQNINEITIGVYSGNQLIVNELDSLAKARKLKNKPTKVIHFKRLKDITPTQIIFVSNDRNDELKKIFDKIEKQPTLLVTDRCEKPELTMINILPLNEGKKRFEINKQNLLEHSLDVAKELLYHGGSEIDLKGLYSQTEKELQAKRELLEAQQKEIEKQEADLKRQKEENQKQKAEIAHQTEEIRAQEQKITNQKEELSQLFQEMQSQEEKLKINLKLLEKQEEKIQDQIELSKLRDQELNEKEASIKEIDKKLAEKNASLNLAYEEIQTKTNLLFMVIGVLVIIFSLGFLALRGWIVNRRINRELKKKNDEINRQKEEIETQAHQLEVTNKELEKLSIVASQTHNAVVIMTPEGKFEWVNAGFTRLYGYTLQLLTHEKGDNISEVSSNQDIQNIIATCTREKKNIIYEALNKTRLGDPLWVQTTLTPIIDESDNVVRLVAIDADITDIKKAQQEIIEQHKKIVEQTKQLEETNKELEKLSIVASETDNAILIMDANGNFEWVNDAYTRMFGYTYDQLTKNISKNIIGDRTDENTRKLINECIVNKKTMNYEFMATTKSGKNIWVQTTLTPIIDVNGNVKKIIAIDSDISRLKDAEKEILHKNEELELQKEKIELQNKQIKSSIIYAQTIQRAILPTKKELAANFDYFEIFMPKDIVSGDFFWFSNMVTRAKMFIAVVDCTGHGVPGAFMSMIGNRLLKEIVHERKIMFPAEILENLNIGVQLALNQIESTNNDGMDVCLCMIEPPINGKYKITYSGAKRPLIIKRKNSQEVDVLKGTRKSIGGVRSKRNTLKYENETTELQAGDIIYLTTDGMIDQNNYERKRYGSDKFIELVKNIATLSMIEQKNKIIQDLHEYMRGEEQRDDITIIGLKLK